MAAQKQQSLSITVHQLDSVCQQLIDQGVADQACKVLFAFLQQGQVDFNAVYRCIEAMLKADDADALNELVDRLEKAFPNDVRTWKLAYLAAYGRRDHEQAWRALSRAEVIGPVTADIIVGKAEIHEKQFQPEKALSLLQTLTEVEAEMKPRLLGVQVAALEQLGRGAEALALLQAFLPGAPDTREVARAAKILGRLHDKEKNYAQAFSAWQQGNEMMLKVAGEPLNQNPVRLRIQAFKQVFEADWVNQWSVVEEAENAPVFLVGFPRSGTTLLEQVLDAHPDVVALEERGGLDHAVNYVDREILGNSFPGDVNQAKGYRYESLAKLTPAQIQKARDIYFSEMSRYVDVKSKECFVDKMPMNMYLVGFIQRIFPQAKIILALRHPADCVLSAWSQTFNLNMAMMHMLDLESAARLHQDMFGLFDQCVNALGVKDRVHEVRYEDLVGDLEASAKKVLRFLDLDWDESVLNYHEHAKSRAIATPSYQGVTQKIYSTSRERWRNYAKWMEPVLPYFRQAAERYGYDLTMPPADTL